MTESEGERGRGEGEGERGRERENGGGREGEERDGGIAGELARRRRWEDTVIVSKYLVHVWNTKQPGPLAQSVERRADNAKVVSSRLTWTNFFSFSQENSLIHTIKLTCVL